MYAYHEGMKRGVILEEGIIIQELKSNGKPESVGRVQFHLINFAEYHGSPLTEDEWWIEMNGQDEFHFHWEFGVLHSTNFRTLQADLRKRRILTEMW